MKLFSFERRFSGKILKFRTGITLGIFGIAGSLAMAQIPNELTNAIHVTNIVTPIAGLETNLPLESATTNLDGVTSTNLASAVNFQMELNLARGQRLSKNTPLATKILTGILEGDAPEEIKRPALFELALVAQDAGEFVKAQQCFSQYIHRYPEDPSQPAVLLRQGLLYRQMGATEMAVSKFYAVMSSSLRLRLGEVDYYKKLVLQAQMEIANTYYLEGKYAESADFFNRISKTEGDDAQVQYKLIRSLSNLTNQVETIARAQVFLDVHPASADVPEVRFILATALKSLGRNQDSMKQVMLLLQSQEDNLKKNPETWIYWQQRAGNSIANQLFKEGDYFNALQIYLTLADLDKTPAWQVPVWYQIGLVYEQLQQPQKAIDSYLRIIDREKDMTSTNTSPGMLSLFDMAKWRKDYVAWMEKARIANKTFQPREAIDQASAAKP